MFELLQIKTWAKFWVPLFIIVDPIGNIPLFLSLTHDLTEMRKRRLAAKGTLVAAGVLSLFALAGDSLLSFFDISLASFRVAGGIILFSISWQMLQARPRATKSSPEEEHEGRQKEDIAIVPLGVPILAGPGAITTVMVLAGGHHIITKLQVAFTSILVCIASYFILSYASGLSRILGHTGTNLFGRLMGLILAVISVEYIARGLGTLFPGWLGP
ncbi:MarC family protein [Thermodesulfatator atlanticus]